jgi:hypothetical protein
MRRFGRVHELRRCRSAGTFLSGDRNEIAGVQLVEDELFGVRRARGCPPSPNTMGTTSDSLTIQTERWRILDSCNKRGHMPSDETWGMFEIALLLAIAICFFTAAVLAVA